MVCAKVPQAVSAEKKERKSIESPIRDAYERLLLDAIRGAASFFAHNDEVEAAWSLITPILEAWQGEGL